MLKSLSIQNIAVIEKAQIEFSKGLNVLTGETGAGKSIIIDSINAILGERTSRELVRSGCDNAFVSGYFEDVDESVNALLDELGIEREDDNSLVVSRKISAQGKSVFRINGVQVTASMLKSLGGLLINIHGQHDSQALLNPDEHFKFLDSYANISPLLDEYKASFKKLLSVRRRLKELTADADDRDKQIELLDYQINELSQADIKVGEWEELKQRKELILNSQSITQALTDLNVAFSGNDETMGVIGTVSSVSKSVASVSKNDTQLKQILEKLEALNDSCEIIKDMAQEKLESIDFQPDELDKIEERLSLLYDFSNKYGETEQDMLYYLENAVNRRKSFDNSDEELERLNALYDEAFSTTVSLSQKLTAERKSAAKRLSEEICEQLMYLDMPKTVFSVDFQKGNLSSNGEDKIEFLISTNPGEPPKPLVKIASGGELSRIMLAIKSIIAKNDSVQTLIFDEIDTGVSGKASRKIGLKLKEVGESTQVICVTHSAQIASVADNHLLIEKKYDEQSTFTSVRPLDYQGRRYELARIMGGLEITDSLLTTAEEMLDDNEIISI